MRGAWALRWPLQIARRSTEGAKPDVEREPGYMERDLPLLRQAQHRHGTQVAATGLPDILWFTHDGEAMQEADWHVARALGLLLARTDDCESAEAAVAVLFNADTEPREFRLPAPVADASWTCRYRTHSDDTADAMSGPAFRLTGPGLAVLSFFTD